MQKTEENTTRANFQAMENLSKKTERYRFPQETEGSINA